MLNKKDETGQSMVTNPVIVGPNSTPKETLLMREVVLMPMTLTVASDEKMSRAGGEVATVRTSTICLEFEMKTHLNLYFEVCAKQSSLRDNDYDYCFVWDSKLNQWLLWSLQEYLCGML